jgi:hypothetical protein
MRTLIKNCALCNDTPEAVVNGRGFKRRKFTPEDRLNLGVQLVLGEVAYKPSIKDVAALVGIPLQLLSGELERLDNNRRRVLERNAIATAQEEAEAINAEADAILDAWSKTVATWSMASPLACEVAAGILSTRNVPAAYDFVRAVSTVLDLEDEAKFDSVDIDCAPDVAAWRAEVKAILAAKNGG